MSRTSHEGARDVRGAGSTRGARCGGPRDVVPPAVGQLWVLLLDLCVGHALFTELLDLVCGFRRAQLGCHLYSLLAGGRQCSATCGHKPRGGEVER